MAKRAKPAVDELPMPASAVEPFRELLGFTAQQWTRATSLVMIHMLLDELLTLLIVRRMDSAADEPTQERIIGMVSGLAFERRVRFALEGRWIPKAVAKDLRETNRVRNALLHFRLGRLRPPEIMSRAAFLQAMTLATDALVKLTKLAPYVSLAGLARGPGDLGSPP